MLWWTKDKGKEKSLLIIVQFYTVSIYYLYKYAGHDISVTNPFLEYLIDKDGQKKKKCSGCHWTVETMNMKIKSVCIYIDQPVSLLTLMKDIANTTLFSSTVFFLFTQNIGKDTVNNT